MNVIVVEVLPGNIVEVIIVVVVVLPEDIVEVVVVVVVVIVVVGRVVAGEVSVTVIDIVVRAGV